MAPSIDERQQGERQTEVFTAIPLPEVMVQALLQSTRRVEQQLVRQEELLTDARERLIRMEQVDHTARISALETDLKVTKQTYDDRIKKLEHESIERRGMQKLVDWFVRYGWVILVGVVFAVLLGLDKVGLK